MSRLNRGTTPSHSASKKKTLSTQIHIGSNLTKEQTPAVTIRIPRKKCINSSATQTTQLQLHLAEPSIRLGSSTKTTSYLNNYSEIKSQNSKTNWQRVSSKLCTSRTLLPNRQQTTSSATKNPLQ